MATVFVGGGLSDQVCAETPVADSAVDDDPPKVRTHCLYTIPAEGGEPRRLTDDGDFHAGCPVWSPDGKYIAYDLWGPGVVVIRADGSEKEYVGAGGMPTWSPDSKQVAYHTYSPGSIEVVNRDGTGRKQIIDHWGNPRWTNDPNRFASLKEGGIAIYDALADTETMVVPRSWNVTWGWSLSRDSRRAAFCDGRGRLYVANLSQEAGATAKVRKRLTNGYVNFSSWSPDGKKMIVAWGKHEKSVLQLYILDPDGDELKKDDKPVLLPGQDPSRKNFQPSWSPDGKTIVYRS